MTTLGKTEERGLMSAREGKRLFSVGLLGLVLIAVGVLVIQNPEAVLSIVNIFVYDGQLDRMQKYPNLIPEPLSRYEDIGEVVAGGVFVLIIGVALMVLTLMHLIFRN